MGKGCQSIEYENEDKYIKTKIKIYDDRVNTNFHDQKVPKENTAYKCISLIMLDSVKNYHQQILLEEYIYAIKRIKWKTLSIMI